MENILIIIIVAIAFLVIGYLFGRRIAEDKFPKKIEEALTGQRAGIKGSLSQNVAPLLPNFPGKASEARFLGAPIDFLIFNGMDDNNISEVVFVEVKTGKQMRLNDNELSLKKAIQEKRVRWVAYQPEKIMMTKK